MKYKKKIVKETTFKLFKEFLIIANILIFTYIYKMRIAFQNLFMFVILPPKVP